MHKTTHKILLSAFHLLSDKTTTLHYNQFMALWNMSMITRVSQYQKVQLTD